MPFTEALRQPFTDIAGAKRWIDALHAAGLAFHFDDDPHDCLYDLVTEEEAGAIYEQRTALYAFQWGPQPGLGFWYCPIGYLLSVERAGGQLPYSGEPTLAHGDLAVIDRDDHAPGYVYGEPGRYEVRRQGEAVGRFDSFAPMGEAFPELAACEHFRLCIQLETRAAQ